MGLFSGGGLMGDDISDVSIDDESPVPAGLKPVGSGYIVGTTVYVSLTADNLRVALDQHYPSRRVATD